MGSRHVDLGRDPREGGGLVDEHQTRRIKLPMVLFPLRPATSGRSCSLGCMLIFEAEAFVLEKVPDRAIADLDPALRQLRKQRTSGC